MSCEGEELGWLEGKGVVKGLRLWGRVLVKCAFAALC